MKPKIIYSDKILNGLSWFMKIGGITLFPFIFLRENLKNTPWGSVVINHEMIHIKQQKELLVILFYLLYVLFYVYNLFKYKIFKRKKEIGKFGHIIKNRAYKNIPFEKEAKANEGNKNYLKERKPFAWVNYI